jgi:hypothetical protein
MKATLPWVFAALLLAGLGVQYASNWKDAAESAQLREENETLRARTEAERKMQPAALTNSDELAQFRKDRQDLFRIRNEVRQLRDEMRQLAHPCVQALISTNVSVSYNPAIWEPTTRLEGSGFRSSTWVIQRPGWLQITVGSDPDRNNERDYKRLTIMTQTGLLGDPAEFVGERREYWGGRDWLVLEFHNAHYRPPRRELSYFLPAGGAGIIVWVAGDEARVSEYQEAIATILGQVLTSDWHEDGTLPLAK